MRKLCFIVLIFLVFIFTACEAKTLNTSNEDIVADNYSETLDAFLPEAPFSWTYKGNNNYIQVMSIMKIFDTNSTKVYKVSGEVMDVTKGSNRRNFNINLTYTVTYNKLIQDKIEEVMLDSEFNKLTLLKLPLETGNSWVESVYDLEGNKEQLNSKIVKIEGESPNRIITVEYKIDKKKYLETRKIRENVGVIEFNKKVNFDNEQFVLGYKLEKFTRGLKFENTNVNDIKNVNSKTTDTDAINNKKENTTQVVKETKNKENTSDFVEKEKVSKLIIDFDTAWIRYINNSDKSVFDYLYSSGKAYSIIQNYKNVEFTEKFLKINVDKVEIDGNNAKAYVYEKLEKNTSGKIKVYEYNWIYILKKINNVWQIDYYVKNKD
ncbi:nuclear transport factor 2 family protein [Helicovermis profundi]|uniref:Lipoprotein n=1 Tax=Helicovermis profundi TaxID=3065157 RepID=A0AAU9E6C1_9FIRM|nr:hypothetical protein HLPR_12640 [Clostridia bacterium S502]